MSEMEILRQNFDDLQKGIKSDTNKMLNVRVVGDNEFHTTEIRGYIEEPKNNILSVMNNLPTSNGNEDVLPKGKELKDLCLIDEVAEVVEPGTEEVHLNEEVQLVMDQRQQATQIRVINRRTLTIGFHRSFCRCFLSCGNSQE